MTREELAVQVAEKVWGLKRNEYGNWCEPDGEETYEIDSSADEIAEYVFSWEGFGRTVEAMTNKKYIPFIEQGAPYGSTDENKGKGVVEFCFFKNHENQSKSYFMAFNGDKWNPQDWIETTHKAALEVME